jgi:hypothetical protein
MQALALAQLLIPLIPTIASGVEHLIAFIGSVRAAAQQTGEWTPAMEEAFRAALLATKTDPAYQPDQPQSGRA